MKRNSIVLRRMSPERLVHTITRRLVFFLYLRYGIGTVSVCTMRTVFLNVFVYVSAHSSVGRATGS